LQLSIAASDGGVHCDRRQVETGHGGTCGVDLDPFDVMVGLVRVGYPVAHFDGHQYPLPIPPALDVGSVLLLEIACCGDVVYLVDAGEYRSIAHLVPPVSLADEGRPFAGERVYTLTSPR
jgi:hypothetical protein